SMLTATAPCADSFCLLLRDRDGLIGLGREDPTAPQTILIIRLLYRICPILRPVWKTDSLIVIIYIKGNQFFLNKFIVI
ncbi:hypothetical protein, partial [Bacteroides graminisolvens]|uniref:hypothetical protein n=1 Tax=Bacteroides graminisolvens TaxID=477666 RepID=UPI0023F157EE